MTTLQELRERHKKMMEEKANQGGQREGGGSGDWYTLKDGDNLVRFLPGKNNPLEFFAEAHVHTWTDAEGKRHSYRCRRHKGEKCPICDLYFDLWKRHKELGLGKDASGKNIQSNYGNLATKIKAKPRFYTVAVIRALEQEGEYPVKYITLTERLFNKVMDAMTNEDFYDVEDPDNTTMISLESGNDFNVRKTSQGAWPSFDESSPKYKKTPAGPKAKVAEWMEHKLDIHALAEISSYEDGVELAAMIESSLYPSASTNTQKNDSESESDEKFSKDIEV